MLQRGLLSFRPTETILTHSRKLGTCLTEIWQPDLPVAAVKNWIGHVVENHVLKTIGRSLNRGLLSFKHLETF